MWVERHGSGVPRERGVRILICAAAPCCRLLLEQGNEPQCLLHVKPTLLGLRQHHGSSTATNGNASFKPHV